MDGVDCALVDFSDGSPNQIDFITTEIPKDLRQNLLALCEDHHGQVSLLGEADIEFSRCLTSSVDRLLKKNQLKRTQVKAIGSHGQTIRHQPSGNAPLLCRLVIQTRWPSSRELPRLLISDAATWRQVVRCPTGTRLS